MAAAYSDEIPAPPPSTGLRPHQSLKEPILYLINLNPSVTESHLANVLQYCTPFRPLIDRDPAGQSLGTGSITFKYFESAEKALATLQSRPVPDTYPPATLSLSPFSPTVPPTPIPAPMAKQRLVKHLPHEYTDSDLYDLFRPFGCLASVHMSPAGPGLGSGTIDFCYEEEAHIAEETMHCAEIQGQNISVQKFTQRKTSGTHSEFSPNAPPFVPSGLPYITYSSPPRSTAGYMSSPFQHGPGQQVQLAPLSGPGSNSHSGLIDPCNLFIKNIDPEIDSNGLFNHFTTFGSIVSARVMRNEQGTSRGFGFVSFQTPEQAANAMHTMNGVLLGNKQIIVRLHEPKQLRQEKLAQRFAGTAHPRTSSGATSPTLSDGGESYGGWPSPGRSHASSNPVLTSERPRRSSGSYYQAALSGNLNLSMQYDDLAALSPVVRREILAGELRRRIKELRSPQVVEGEVDAVVDSLINLSLAEVVEGIHSQPKLAEQIETIKKSRDSPVDSSTQEKAISDSPAPSQESRLLDAEALIATASAPEQPSTPLSISGSISDPPRTSSPSGSTSALGEKDRLLVAVSKLENNEEQAAAITNLLMSLSKRERAMCLFSNEILKQKVKEAKEIFELGDEPDEEAVKTPPPKIASTLSNPTPSDSVPMSKETSNLPALSLVIEGSEATSVSNGSPPTLASLAKLSASEILKVVRDPATSRTLPLPKPDLVLVQSTDAWIDSLQVETIVKQKQALGEKLYKYAKAAGLGKSAQRTTIQVVDIEDIRALAHLMNSYPAVLKEKLILASKSISAK